MVHCVHIHLPGGTFSVILCQRAVIFCLLRKSDQFCMLWIVAFPVTLLVMCACVRMCYTACSPCILLYCMLAAVDFVAAMSQ